MFLVDCEWKQFRLITFSELEEVIKNSFSVVALLKSNCLRRDFHYCPHRFCPGCASAFLPPFFPIKTESRTKNHQRKRNSYKNVYFCVDVFKSQIETAFCSRLNKYFLIRLKCINIVNWWSCSKAVSYFSSFFILAFLSVSVHSLTEYRFAIAMNLWETLCAQIVLCCHLIKQ